MHNALAHPRIHHPKNHVVGIYSPDGPMPPAHVQIPDGRGVGVHPDTCVFVPAAKGQIFKSMGQADRWNRVWLLPEEAIYLVERGSLDIRWPSSEIDAEGEEVGNKTVPAIPMSLQAAYACFMGRGGLTLERYSVFTGLRRLGYVITRAPGWDDTATVDSNDASRKGAYTQAPRRGAGLAGIFSVFFDWLHDPLSTASTSVGPIVGCGIHPNYSEPCSSLIADRLLTDSFSRHLQKARYNSLVRPDRRNRTKSPRRRNTIPRRIPRLQTLNTIQENRPAKTRLPHRGDQHPRDNLHSHPGATRRFAGKHPARPSAWRQNGAVALYAAAAWVSECGVGGC